jgi:hypothetical protein
MVSSPTAPGAGDEGPPRGRLAEDGTLGESRSSKPNSSGRGAPSGQSGPKSHNSPYQTPRVDEDSEKRSASSASSDVSEEQLQQIHKLVYEGMAEKLAREEVLGKGWVEP